MGDAPSVTEAHFGLANRIEQAIKRSRLPLENEKRLQAAIAERFEAATIAHTREMRGVGGVIDFVCWDDDVLPDRRVQIGVEVKIKGNVGAIRRQLVAYAAEPAFDALVLVTARPFRCGLLIGGKPLYTYDISRGWL